MEPAPGNVKRRNLTKSQTAIAAAEAWDQAEAEGKVQKQGTKNARRGRISNPRQHFADLFGAGKNQIQQARALLDRAPDLAEAVKAGTTAPADAVYRLDDVEVVGASLAVERRLRAPFVFVPPLDLQRCGAS